MVTSLQSNTFFYLSYFLAILANFIMVSAMLLFMTEVEIILKSKCGNTSEFLQSNEKEFKIMLILPIKLTLGVWSITCFWWWWWWWWWGWILFAEWLAQEGHLALFSAEITLGGSHHYKPLACHKQDLNLYRN